jgi:hypothetical protein
VTPRIYCIAARSPFRLTTPCPGDHSHYEAEGGSWSSRLPAESALIKLPKPRRSERALPPREPVTGRTCCHRRIPARQRRSNSTHWSGMRVHQSGSHDDHDQGNWSTQLRSHSSLRGKGSHWNFVFMKDVAVRFAARVALLSRRDIHVSLRAQSCAWAGHRHHWQRIFLPLCECDNTNV